jgi:hypothetical protein
MKQIACYYICILCYYFNNNCIYLLHDYEQVIMNNYCMDSVHIILR